MGMFVLLILKMNGQLEPLKTSAKIEWEFSQTFDRYDDLVIQMGGMLGYTSAQMDDLWLYAGTI